MLNESNGQLKKVTGLDGATFDLVDRVDLDPFIFFLCNFGSAPRANCYTCRPGRAVISYQSMDGGTGYTYFIELAYPVNVIAVQDVLEQVLRVDIMNMHTSGMIPRGV